jgi:hypothetical protein
MPNNGQLPLYTKKRQSTDRAQTNAMLAQDRLLIKSRSQRNRIQVAGEPSLSLFSAIHSKVWIGSIGAGQLTPGRNNRPTDIGLAFASTIDIVSNQASIDVGLAFICSNDILANNPSTDIGSGFASKT